MLSQKAKYAMRALLYLAQSEPEQPILIGDIAEQQQVPRKFLELILLELKRNGLVRSFRGKHGGYIFAPQPRGIYFGHFIPLFYGPLGQLPCASQTGHRPRCDCQERGTCPTPKEREQ